MADRYRPNCELGQGGMATGYLAHDLTHDRDVALKVLRPELVAVLGRDRFLTEIRLTARLDHPHILTLIDSGESDGFLWYVIPYVRGESLRDRLNRDKQLGVEEALVDGRPARAPGLPAPGLLGRNLVLLLIVLGHGPRRCPAPYRGRTPVPESSPPARTVARETPRLGLPRAAAVASGHPG